MRTISHRLVFLFVLTANTALGADLAKIDRTIAKQPKYQDQPYYVLLVFLAVTNDLEND